MSRTRAARDDGMWGRRRLLGVVGAGLLVAFLVVAGIVLACVQVVRGDEHQGSTVATTDTSATEPQTRRDAAALTPMTEVPHDSMWPSSVDETAMKPELLQVPPPVASGAEGVMTGFPHTPEGAVAQLAAIERSSLTSMDVTTVERVRRAWSAAGHLPAAWGLSDDVKSFRQRAGVTDGAHGQLSVTAEPAAGLVKAADGPDWTVACVLMQVRASYRATGEVAYGRCDPMAWEGERWVLAAGEPAAPAPSTWPGTTEAAEAGWRPLVLGGTGSSASDSAPTAPQGVALPVTIQGIHIPNPLDPLGELGGVVAGAAADAWTSAMLAIWGGGLWLLRLVLDVADMFLTPDLTESGPGRNAYVNTFWLASALVLVMVLIQLGSAAFKREGRAIARVLIGSAQFVIVWSCWLGYCVTVVAACGELTHALMEALLGAGSWRAWDPVPGLEASDVSDSAVATVLGLLGCVLWVAALGHLFVMLARAASLIVLVATGPIAAAGLVADAGRAWFWKSLRWFHAAALTPLLMVLVLGIGAQVSAGVAGGLTDSTQAAVGTALPSVLLLCVACVAPLALFKLLAFVDPGTSSGAAFRQGMSASGGLQGLLGGGKGQPAGGAGASQGDGSGRSSGEASAESATSERFAGPIQKGLGMLGGAGQAMSLGIGAVQKVGAVGTSLLGDESNQSGVGHQTHTPDFSSLRGGSSSGSSGPGGGHASAPKSDHDGDQDNGARAGSKSASGPLPVPSIQGAVPAAPTVSSGSAGASGAAASGAAIPPVPL